jgi:four helix bundle protein
MIDIAYEITKQLPAEERFVASTQLRRAAWSVQNNIAEGYARRGANELRRFFDVSLASLAEVDSMLAKLSELYCIDASIVAEAESLRRAITKLLFAMIRRRRGDND